MYRFLAAVTVVAALSATARAEEKAVGHMVFFQLKESTPENQKKLVDACYTYLKGIPGITYFSAGPRATEAKEPVSATDWDVALHVVFNDLGALKKYITHPDHVKFVNMHKEMWKGVKVYDSTIDPDRTK